MQKRIGTRHPHTGQEEIVRQPHFYRNNNTHDKSWLTQQAPFVGFLAIWRYNPKNRQNFSVSECWQNVCMHAQSFFAAYCLLCIITIVPFLILHRGWH